MATTTSTPGLEVDVLGLDDEAVLATIAEHRTEARRAEVAELRAVAAYADRHRVTAGEWLTRGSMSREGRDMVWDLDDHPAKAAELAHEAGELGTEGILRLAGEGAFSVREFAVTDLAATLELSEHSARAYVAQAVELRDRLPRLWSQVMTGRLPVWKARRVAEQTIQLKATTARFVDDQLAEFAHRLSITRITRCVEAAIIRHQPDLAEKKAQAAAEHRGVWLEADTLDGLTSINATLDSPDAHALDRALDDTATVLGALGDASSRDVRRARAIGVLADPQYALDLHTTATSTPSCSAQRSLARRGTRPRPAWGGTGGRDAPRAEEAWRHVARVSPATAPDDTAGARGVPAHGRSPTRPRPPCPPSAARDRRLRAPGRSHYSDRSPSATTPPPSLGAAEPALPTTWTTSTRTSIPTRAAHPARPRPSTPRGCAATTTA